MAAAKPGEKKPAKQPAKQSAAGRARARAQVVADLVAGVEAPPVVETPDMSVAEMKEILKGIARDGSNGAARIAAVRQLRAIQLGEAPPGAFSELDELAPRRGLRGK